MSHLHAGNQLGQHIGADGARVKGRVRSDRDHGDRHLLGILRMALGGHRDFRELVAARSRIGRIGVGRRTRQQADNGTCGG